MYDPERKQVILKNSLGVSYHVFYDPGRGLCVRMLGDSGLWSRGFVLSDTAVNDFSVTLDKEDIFHFLFQSKDGRILYGHGRHGQIEIQPILYSKDVTPWPKHVSLLICGDYILFFYMVRYQKKHLLSMQTCSGGKLSKPAAVDYADGSGGKYLAFTDRTEKCHLIYTRTENSETHLLHRVMQDDFSTFHAPEKIHLSRREISFPSAVCSDGNEIHLSFQVYDGELYEILYKNLSLKKNAESLYRSKFPPGYTGLVYHRGIIRFFRIVNENIYIRNSADGGENWSEEAPYPFGDPGALTCFSYYTNVKMERQELDAGEIPGNFSRGYRLAFLVEENPTKKTYFHPENAESHSIPDLMEKEPDSAGNRSSGRGENGDTPENAPLKSMQKKIILLQNLTENMRRELTKLWITQKEYDKKLERLRLLYGRLREHFYAGLQENTEQNPEEKMAEFTEPTEITEPDIKTDINADNGPDTRIPPE